MRYAEKLYQQMVQRRFNQQQLAEASGVSDSEVSRILKGHTKHPGLDSAFRLARALGISLDYLADDALDADPSRPSDPVPADDREILELAHQLGRRQARWLLETATKLGYDAANRRLLGAELKPVIEVGDGGRSAPAAGPAASPSRASTG